MGRCHCYVKYDPLHHHLIKPKHHRHNFFKHADDSKHVGFSSHPCWLMEWLISRFPTKFLSEFTRQSTGRWLIRSLLISPFKTVLLGPSFGCYLAWIAGGIHPTHVWNSQHVLLYKTVHRCRTISHVFSHPPHRLISLSLNHPLCDPIIVVSTCMQGVLYLIHVGQITKLRRMGRRQNRKC